VKQKTPLPTGNGEFLRFSTISHFSEFTKDGRVTSTRTKQALIATVANEDGCQLNCSNAMIIATVADEDGC
jgi:hypothetical protein